jgi:hypothetical protein
MPEHTIRFDTLDSRTMKLPHELLRDGGRYVVELRDGDIYLSGNTAGLLYLAEILIQCAKGGFDPSFHVHLPLDSKDSGPPGQRSSDDSLVIFAAGDGTRGVIDS